VGAPVESADGAVDAVEVSARPSRRWSSLDEVVEVEVEVEIEVEAGMMGPARDVMGLKELIAAAARELSALEAGVDLLGGIVAAPAERAGGQSAFDELARAAATPERAGAMMAADVTSLLLRGLGAPDAHTKESALRGLLHLLHLSLHVPEAQQKMVQTVETVLGMAFHYAREVRQQALQLLSTLVKSPACLRLLCEPSPYRTTLSIARIQAEHADYPATLQALQIVDKLLLAGGLQHQQQEQALELCSLLSDCEDETVLLASTRTARLCEAHVMHGDESSLQQQGWHGLWQDAVNQVQEQVRRLRDDRSQRRSSTEQ